MPVYDDKDNDHGMRVLAEKVLNDARRKGGYESRHHLDLQFSFEMAIDWLHDYKHLPDMAAQKARAHNAFCSNISTALYKNASENAKKHRASKQSGSVEYYKFQNKIA